MANEAFARVKIEALLAAQGWDTGLHPSWIKWLTEIRIGATCPVPTMRPYGASRPR